MKTIITYPTRIIKKPLSWFRRASLKKKILVVILIIILFFIAAAQIQRATQPPPYTLATAQVSDITETVNETGSINASGATQIYPPTNGVVREIYVANGAEVVEGQSLFLIESTATEQEKQTAYANYLTAVTALNAAKTNLYTTRADMYTKWDTYRNLATSGEYENSEEQPDLEARKNAEFQIAQDNWYAAEKNYKDQQTAVSQASAQVSSTWLLYQATQNATVKAPTSGTLSNLSVSIGSATKANSPTALTATTPLATIANFGITEVKVALSETDITKVHPGQKATIDVSAVNDSIYKGVVRRVDTIGTDDQGVIRYNAYIEVTNPDARLHPGMTADTTIITRELNDALSVPNSAIKPYQGKRAVRVPDSDTNEVKYIPVEIGIRGKERTQILRGIDEGQQVITSLSNEQLKRPGLF